jgi:membrane protein required for colicin V production
MTLPDIGWVDAAMLGVIALSVLVGAVRGITFEVLSLAGWFAAWSAGLWVGPLLAPYLPIGSAGSALNRGVAFASAFLVVLVLWSLAVSALIAATPLRLLDRFFGALFGLARGVLVLLAIALLLSLSPAGQMKEWRESQGAFWLNAILRELAPLLPFPAGPAPGAKRV